MLTNAINTAQSSLLSASKSLQNSANNIASLATNGQNSRVNENGDATVARRAEGAAQVEGGLQNTLQQQQPVSLEREIVNQKFATYQFDASAKVIETADEMNGNLLDILS